MNTRILWLAAVLTVAACDGADPTGVTPPPETPVPTPTPGAPVVASVEIDADSVALAEGGIAQLVATARDSAGNVVTGRFVGWTSSEPEVAQVAPLGALTAVRTGSAVITAKVDGKTASIPVRVTADYPYSLVFAGWTAAEPDPRIYGVDLDDAERAHVRVGPDAPTGNPVPSPDGSRIAFLRLLENGDRAIVVADFDGTDAVTLVQAGDVSCGSLAWSPDGARLAFSCRIGDDDPDIWVVSAADGSGLLNLTANHDGGQQGPSWSPQLPDGTHRIAYAQYVNGEPQIWTMKDDGSDPKQITAGMDWQPAWSPDGTTIAFQRTGVAIFGDLWLVDADGGNERRLMPGTLAGPQWSPVWSPDGRLLAFSSSHETYGSGAPVSQIYTVWADGSKLARRTTGDQDKGAPAWRAR